MNTPVSPQVKALLFDLDGTVVDNSVVHFEAWRKLGQSIGRDITHEEYTARYIGKNTNEVIDMVWGGGYDQREIETLYRQKLAHYEDELVRKDRVVAGFREIAKAARHHGLAVALVSNASPDSREVTLRSASLGEYFQLVVGPETGLQLKPNPDMYLHAAKTLGVRPEHCVVFEDTPSGIRAGIDAGMRVVGIASSYDASRLVDAHAVTADYRKIRLITTDNVVSIIRDQDE